MCAIQLLHQSPCAIMAVGTLHLSTATVSLTGPKSRFGHCCFFWEFIHFSYPTSVFILRTKIFIRVISKLDLITYKFIDSTSIISSLRSHCHMLNTVLSLSLLSLALPFSFNQSTTQLWHVVGLGIKAKASCIQVPCIN